MSPAAPYSAVLAANIRAARSRAAIHQEELAARMRTLGYTSWRSQTVGSVERGTRRVMAEEILGLAVALRTPAGALLSPTADDGPVSFPSGASVSVESVRTLVRGYNDGAVTWDGAKPIMQPL